MARDNGNQDLSYVIPKDHDYDFHMGYIAGQRTVHLNAYLNPFSQKNVADLRFMELGSQQISLVRYRSGFRHGYHDELWGLAHPLPPTDTAYRHDEFTF